MIEAVSVVIPAFNEERAIRDVIEEVRGVLSSLGVETEIVVVDDGSTDTSAEVAEACAARVLRHVVNRGYGAALKTGIAAATHANIIIIDADGTYPAVFLKELLARVDQADMIVGARTGPKVRVPLVRRPAKWVLNLLANYLCGRTIPDLNSGLRVFRRDGAIGYFDILPDKFSWTSTITLAMLFDKRRIDYVPIDYRTRTGQSKVVTLDFGRFVGLLLRMGMRFRPWRVLAPPIAGLLAIAALWLGR
ncbi:MAG: glycosyltransferase family 2 protein [Noviherbaspirillum sp.]